MVLKALKYTNMREFDVIYHKLVGDIDNGILTERINNDNEFCAFYEKFYIRYMLLSDITQHINHEKYIVLLANKFRGNNLEYFEMYI